MNIKDQRDKRWGERNIGGCLWGMIFATVAWSVIIAVGVLIYRAVH